MKIIGVWYGACGWYGGREVSNWRDAEEFAKEELLEDMDFTNIRCLSEKDATFPFDFIAERHGEKCLIDVTLRTRKPVKTKRLRTWRALGYRTFLLVIVPKWMMAILIELEDSDRWVNISNTMLERLEKEWRDTITLKPLETFTNTPHEATASKREV